MKHPSLILVFGLCLVAVGCDEDSENASETAATDGSETSDGGVDEAAIIEQAVGYTGFTKINDAPLPSQHGIPDTVNVWVPAELADTYRNLADGTTFEPGSILVKEQLDADGNVLNMTVMYKGPAGYAPDAGDWWFGLVTPEGEAMVSGQPDACIGCHTGVQASDWVFGPQ